MLPTDVCKGFILEIWAEIHMETALAETKEFLCP